MQVMALTWASRRCLQRCIWGPRVNHEVSKTLSNVQCQLDDVLSSSLKR
jgi:hypothetical protein